MTDLPPEQVQQNWRFRVESLKNIMTQQFQMNYFGKIPYESSDNMSITERKMVYDILYKQKKDEKEAHDKHMREMRAKAEANRSRVSRPAHRNNYHRR